ncbi:MAG: iron-containing alcohol dehydrogenase [Clostridiales Family XIII bacterium]|jgi:alcohol dehydrogenase|nr:iron-containing alcohol dehydrogenase [Clostridiales Family XIII bacterium]
MKDFIFKMPTRVHFGNGVTKKLPDLCKELGGGKIFLISDPVIASTPIMTAVKAALDAGGADYELFTDTKPDPTIEMVDNTAKALADSGASIVVAVGGGSPIDLAKAVAMLQTNEGSVREYLFGGTKTVQNPSIPLIAIPTTAGTGSEMTAATVIGDMQNNIKLSVTHDYIIPKAALIDPQLHVGMPPIITASTGLDALTHAIESYVSLNAEPISDALGLHAMRLIGANLRTAVADGNNIEARSNMAVASLIASVAFMNGGLGVVHGIAQSMGGLHHTPHGIANGLLLPYAMDRNYVGNFRKFRDIAVALGIDVEGLSDRDAAYTAVEAVFDLQEDVRVPRTLKEIDIEEKDFQAIIDGTMPYRLLAVNPCKLVEKDIRGILEKAYEGR